MYPNPFGQASLVPHSGLTLPAATFFDSAGDFVFTLTFPQDMDILSVPAAGDFTLKNIDGAPVNAQYRSWASATQFEINYDGASLWQAPQTIDYVKGAAAFKVLADASEYDSWSNLPVVTI